ncbi:MAG TPA: tetratricopeptide repeat protein [Armatimonadota bacterium]|nr:tetratricopeptide repeat protein [Armatimonadota bacterium]
MGDRRLRIKQAFEVIKDEQNDVKFERLVCCLLRRMYPNINPMPHVHDLGQDAVASPLTPVRMDDRWFSFAISLDWRLAKLRQDCSRCREEGHTIDVIVFVTSDEVTGNKRKQWKTAIKQDFGWDLEVHDQSFLLNEAMAQENALYVKEFLGIHVPKDLGLQLSSPVLPPHISSVQVVNNLVRDRIEYGVTLRENWKPRQAIDVFRAVLEQCRDSLSDKDRARVHTNLAAAQAEIGNFDEAQENLDKAKALRPKDVRVHSNLAILQMARGDYPAARRVLESAFRKVKPDARANAVYANVLWALREDKKALRRAEMAIKADRSISQSHVVRGLILRFRGELDAALKEFEDAELDPNNYFVRGLKLETLAHLMTKGQASADLDELDRESANWLHEISRIGTPPPKSLEPARAVLFSARGLILMLKGKLDEAAAAFQAALEYKEEPAGHQNLGMVYLAQEKKDEADTEFRKGVALGAKDVFLQHNIAFHCLDRFQDGGFKEAALLEEAKQYFATVKEQLPDDPETALLEAAVIHADSEYRQDDMGIGKAKALLDRVVLDKDCPQDLSKRAFSNLRALEKLERHLEENRRRQWRLKHQPRR